MVNSREITDDDYFSITKAGFLSDTSRLRISVLPGENNQLVRAEIMDSLGNSAHPSVRPADPFAEGIFCFQNKLVGRLGNCVIAGVFFLNGPKEISINVYDLSGVSIASLVNGRFSEGLHYFFWNTRNAGNGLYVMSMRMGTKNFTRSVAVLR